MGVNFDHFWSKKQFRSFIPRYNCEAWLLPTLKEELFKKLYSQSGKILKVIDTDLSYVQLHKKYKRATPRIYSLYQTCINYYNIMNINGYLLEERIKTMLNTMRSERCENVVFIRQNMYRWGLNNVSNRLRSITNMVSKSSLSLDKQNFKPHCKINIIQHQLESL